MHIYLRLLMPACLAGMLLTQCACHADTLPEPGKNSPEEPDTELADAYHDKTRQQPYPKAGNELYLNPSPLIVPQKMKTGDLLQFSLSRKENFTSSETLISEPKAWCMFNPHHRLETGQWYWRFRSVKADGSTTDWSMTYQFEVKEETPSFVTPAFETFYKNAPRQHPRLYCFLNDRIEQAQRNAPSHPEYKALLSRAASALNVDWQHFGNPYDRIGELKSYVQYLYQAQVLAPKSDYYNRLRHILRLMLDTPIDDRQLFASNFGTTDIAICLTKAYDLLYSGLSHAERENTERLMMRILRVCFNRQCGTEENHIFDNHFWQHNMRILFQTAFILYDKTEYAQEVIPILEYYYELWTARAPASGFNRDGVWLFNTPGISMPARHWYIPGLPAPRATASATAAKTATNRCASAWPLPTSLPGKRVMPMQDGMPANASPPCAQISTCDSTAWQVHVPTPPHCPKEKLTGRHHLQHLE